MLPDQSIVTLLDFQAPAIELLIRQNVPEALLTNNMTNSATSQVLTYLYDGQVKTSNENQLQSPLVLDLSDDTQILNLKLNSIQHNNASTVYWYSSTRAVRELLPVKPTSSNNMIFLDDALKDLILKIEDKNTWVEENPLTHKQISHYGINGQTINTVCYDKKIYVKVSNPWGIKYSKLIDFEEINAG